MNSDLISKSLMLFEFEFEIRIQILCFGWLGLFGLVFCLLSFSTPFAGEIILTSVHVHVPGFFVIDEMSIDLGV